MPVSPELSLEPNQAATRKPTSFEDAFADELEAVYGRGVHDLAGVVAALNETGVRPADGADWTETSFRALLAELAEEN